MHELEYKLVELANRVREIDEELAQELMDLASMSHNYAPE